MPERYKDQRELWEKQHQDREQEARDFEGVPTDFTRKCVGMFSPDSVVLEIGAANGRDSRFFTKEKNCTVIATDFSLNALRQLQDASRRNGTAHRVFPVIADSKALPLGTQESVDVVYARSSLHLSDEELDRFFQHILTLLKDDGYIMIEGKTEKDEKITKSAEISPHVYKNGEGHIRRAWSETIIREIVQRYKLRLLEMNQTTEVRNNIETQFINFIAQKQKHGSAT